MVGKFSQGDEQRQFTTLTPGVFHVSSIIIQQCLPLDISHIVHLFSSYCTEILVTSVALSVPGYELRAHHTHRALV